MGVGQGEVPFLEGGRGAAGSWVSPSQLVPLHGADPATGLGRAVNISIALPVGFGQGPSPRDGVAKPPSWIWLPAASLPSAQLSPPLEETVERDRGGSVPSVPSGAPCGYTSPWVHVPEAAPAAAPGDLLALSTEKGCWWFLCVISLKDRRNQSWRRPMK